jgi:phosphoglycerate kinase
MSEGLENMLKKIEDINLTDKRVLIRVDFNVPLDENGEITDDFRIKSALSTIKYALGHEAKQVILMSHLGRPKGEVVENYKMDNVATRLSELIGEGVAKVNDCIDIELPSSKIVLLENLRFHKEEKKNDDQFAMSLASYADVYVNDAFGTCHRAHASVDAITKYVDEIGAGLLVQKEVEMLGPVLKAPKHPFYVVLGGAKVEGKIDVIKSLGHIADKVFIGGKMALAFDDVSYIDQEERNKAAELRKEFSDKIVLPIDYVTEYEDIIDSSEIPSDVNLYDVGVKTVDMWKKLMADGSTIVWNGPLGYFEKKPFDKATNMLAEYLSTSDASVIIGGGDSASAVRILGLADKMDHVSTGGGASLEFLEGKELPGLKVLGYYE